MSKPIKKVVVINGKPTAGKDEFVIRCRKVAEEKNLGISINNVSSVGAVKQAALVLGWCGVKDDVSRNALSDLKVISEKAWNGPNNYMLSEIKENDGISFLHIREVENINEISRLCVANDIDVTTVYINRDVEVTATNVGDTNALDPDFYPYNVVIDNDSTLEKFEECAETYLDMLLGEENDIRQKRILTPNEINLVNERIETYFKSKALGIKPQFSSYNELVNITGSVQKVKDNIARFLGGTIIDSDNEGFRIWQFPEEVKFISSFADVGIFDFDTNWNSLIKIYEAVGQTEIEITDPREAFERIALHIHNYHEIEGAEFDNM